MLSTAYDNPTNSFKAEIFDKSHIRSINELLGNIFFLFFSLVHVGDRFSKVFYQG